MDNNQGLSKKQQGKRKSTSEHPKVTIGIRTKMPTYKGLRVKIVTMGSGSKSSKSSKVPHPIDPTFILEENARSRNLVALCLKVNHLVSHYKYKAYVFHFLNKFVALEYYMDKVIKKEINIDFLNHLKTTTYLKFIYLHGKFNPHHVKAFYCHVKISFTYIHCHFDRKLIKYTIKDFNIMFGLENKGMKVCQFNALVFDHTQFFKTIFKTFLKGPLDYVNFRINQMKCPMRMLHWVVVKVW